MSAMRAVLPSDTLATVKQCAASTPGLRLLVLHGSRARGEAHDHSDWDFGYQGDATFDADGLLASLVEALDTDRIDLVDLDRASALLRYRTAAVGIVVLERTPRAFEQFTIDAVTTWCDLVAGARAGVRGYPRPPPPMSPISRAVLAERTSAVRRHLARVAGKLPSSAGALEASTDAADAVTLHLYQATQIVIDMAVAFCAAKDLGTPASYADGFRRLEAAGIIDRELADRLVRAAGFRNVVAHAYGTLDMARVHKAASSGPADLLAFLAVLDRALSSGEGPSI